MDGAHIRTLLLTFFFRQMPELIEAEKIYIAQPPLYEIRLKGKKDSEYLLSEPQMRKQMENRGLEGARLIIREDDKPPRIIEMAKLALLIKILNDAERSIGVLERRGIIFREFVESYFDGRRLPVYHIRYQGQSEFFYEKAEYEKRQAELDKMEDAEETTEEQRQETGEYLVEELHEVLRLNEIHEHLQREFQLDMRDFLLKISKSDDGEDKPGKFEILSGERSLAVPSLDQAAAVVRKLGSEGMEIKRFKGLGEMNSDQLWETTMDPGRRTLLKVEMEDAGEADRLFSILMGDDVEKRRKFIQEHALEVQNLDI